MSMKTTLHSQVRSILLKSSTLIARHLHFASPDGRQHIAYHHAGHSSWSSCRAGPFVHPRCGGTIRSAARRQQRARKR